MRAKRIWLGSTRSPSTDRGTAAAERRTPCGRWTCGSPSLRWSAWSRHSSIMSVRLRSS